MKSLPVAEGQHQCTWDFYGHTLEGTVELAASRRPDGIIYDVPFRLQGADVEVDEDGLETPVFFTPSVVCTPELKGRLRSTGQTVVLFEVHLMHGIDNQTTLIANRALCGTNLNVKEDLEFDHVSFQAEGLVELSGEGPLKPISSPSQFNPPNTPFNVEWNPQSRQEWSLEDDTITIDYTAVMRTGDPYRYHISPSPSVTVRGPARPITHWIDQYVEPVRSLCEFSTSRPQSLSYVLFHFDITSPWGTLSQEAQLFSPSIIQQNLIADRPGLQDVILLRCGRSGYALPDLIKGLREIARKNSTFYELFAGSYRTTLPLRSAFLVFLPALESLHASEYGLGPHSRETQKSRKKELIAEAKIRGFSKDHVRWLRKSFDERGDYSLPERLRALYASLPDECQEAIDAERARATVPQGRVSGDVWNVVTRARNELAHGGPVWRDEALMPLYLLVRTLAMALLLQRLGKSTQPLVDAIKRGSWQATA